MKAATTLDDKMKNVKKNKVKLTRTASLRRNSDGGKMINSYTFEKKLGSGAFAKVKLAKSSLLGKEQLFAVKIFKKAILRKQKEFFKDSNGKLNFKDGLEEVTKEVAIMKKLNHPNLLKLYEVIDAPESEKLYMVLEFAEKGEILKWNPENKLFEIRNVEDFEKNTLDEDYIRKVMRDCLKGLYYLHQNNIIHLDLKPQNILLNQEGTAKIADFGVSSVITNDDKINVRGGTYQFMGPEFFDKSVLNRGFSGKLADIWALGITLYCFVFLELPYHDENPIKLAEIIKKQKLNFPEKREISRELKDLISKMLCKNSKKRIKMNQLIEHPWINKGQPNLKIEIGQLTEEVQVNEEDVRNALLPLARVVFLKQALKRWHSSFKLKKTEGKTLLKSSFSGHFPLTSDQSEPKLSNLQLSTNTQPIEEDPNEKHDF